MAKKKPKPNDNKRKRPKLELPDSRAMEADMRDFLAGIGGQPNLDTPLGKAQSIIDRAFRETNVKKRVALAQEALAACVDCADAYNLLAEHTTGRRAVHRLYEQALAAAERVLGPEVFEREAGQFWSVLETRAYMRARLGLANCLWLGGRHDDAVRHMQELLRLNPGDNQGVRYILASFLLFLDRDDETAELLKAYAERSATWEYSKALLAFRRQGDSEDARHLLRQARRTNVHVPRYLIDDSDLPSGQPPYYSPGDENEAQSYASSFRAPWKFTPGAMAWLRASLCEKKKKPAQLSQGQVRAAIRWIAANLPQSSDVWQAEFRQLSTWIRVGDEMLRPWIVLVTSLSHDLVLGHHLGDESPPTALLWNVLVQALRKPLAGGPHVPTQLQVRENEQWMTLKP
ncbi:MAG: hypothetical protein EHM42_12380, partial [Planctomycetaceae bacterium]